MVEDISDEEFETKNDETRCQHEWTVKGAANNRQPSNVNRDTVQGKEALGAAADIASPKMNLSEDPIEDFSEEKMPAPLSQLPNGNSLASPAKNKRNTDRVTGNYPPLLNIEAANQSETNHNASLGQEIGTTDLILEGLMNDNNKKQKSSIEKDGISPHLFENQKQETDAKLSMQPGASCCLRQTGNPEGHCCSYAAVPPENSTSHKGIQRQYGIISLFDGVSSVVRILKQKLQQPPTAIVLAELDEKLRSLVCAEFGYRADEQWCYTADGATCCYVRDVSTIIKNDCYLLRQVVAMHPNLKWFIVGGSPCQDLTYAGPSQGILGLVGSQSRSFFILLCTMRTMQVLVGTAAVRFLVENAGSMKPVHYVAFYRLLWPAS